MTAAKVGNATRKKWEEVILTAADLAGVQQTEPFLFLLNGWNEIAESNSAQANDALRELERDFPSAGIIVATRTHHLTPPAARCIASTVVVPSTRTAGSLPGSSPWHERHRASCPSGKAAGKDVDRLSRDLQFELLQTVREEDGAIGKESGRRVVLQSMGHAPTTGKH